MKVLALGDVVGPAGLEFVAKNLRRVKLAEGADLVIVNGENASVRGDLDSASATLLFDSGADVVTGGNHTLSRSEVFTMLSENDCLLRPANFPDEAPGKGHCLVRMGGGRSVLVLNLAGQLFMPDLADNPFVCCERLLKQYEGRFDYAVCDLHAEATSEKSAFFRCFDGRIQVMFGTHTHVQTADEQLLPKGSACITDLGMCGVADSVIGFDPEGVTKRFATCVRARREFATGTPGIRGAIFNINEENGCVNEIRRVCL